jgi:hypothetical protein
MVKQMPYHRHYRRALSDAFYVYLTIQRSLDQLVQQALGQDTPNWRVLNACTACNYELEDEPRLKIRRMICLDGNNSLKRVATLGDRVISNTSTFTSDYFLPQSCTDEFKSTTNPGDEDNGDGNDGSVDDNHEDQEGVGDGCKASKWKAAGEKGTWGIFEETGIFASACNHGFILWLLDMIRTGERYVTCIHHNC